MTVGPHDDDFQSPSKSKSQETTTNIADSQFLSNVEPPEFQDEEKKFSFTQVIDEIFNILPEEKFPRKEAGTEDNPRPKSSIESEMVKEKRKSISLPQSALIVDSINFIQNQLKLNNKSFTENWLPTTKDISALANLKYYQAHAEKFMTSSATPLDNDASKLNLSLNGNYQIPIKSLDMYEKQLRETLRMLSHTDVFSFAAFKCLQQESLNPKILSQILESLSLSVKHAVGMVSFLTVELQQTRRDAAIQSAAKSLSLEAKNQLRNIPIASKTLFGGQIDSIYKENSEVNRNKLITKAVAHPRPQSSSLASQQRNKPDPKKSVSHKNSNPSNRESRTSSSYPRPRGGRSGRGYGRMDRAVPSSRGASSARRF